MMAVSLYSMMRSRRFLGGIFSILAVSGFAMSGALAQPEVISTEKDWGVYRHQSDAGRICFISSEPKKKRGNYDRDNRDETRVYVSHGPGKADRNVVQILAGYKYKKQSEVSVTIDGKTAKLFTLEDRAWAMSPEDDQQLIRQMKAGNKLVIKGISSRGNETIDEYSLSGFTAAKNKLDKLCP